MEDVKEMKLVGYYSFSSKDKSKSYYVLQLLNSMDTKAVLNNVFVDENTYKRVAGDYDIGSLLDVKCDINYETNKVYYSIVL